MATGIEEAFILNAISIFGGNPILLALVGLGMFMAAAALTRIPMIVIAPIYAVALIIVASGFPEFVPIAVLIMGTVFAYFIFRFWRGG